MLYGCPFGAIFLPSTSVLRDFFTEEKPGPQLPSKAGTDALLAQFQEARRVNDTEPANRAIAVTFTPVPWAWGTALAQASEDAAKKLALQKCMEDVKLKGLPFLCDVYSVNGRPGLLISTQI